jgi:hypothetical protein
MAAGPGPDEQERLARRTVGAGPRLEFRRGGLAFGRQCRGAAFLWRHRGAADHRNRRDTAVHGHILDRRARRCFRQPPKFIASRFSCQSLNALAQRFANPVQSRFGG